MNDQILPAEISIHSDTWLNRYRNYPIFSAAWYRHRSIAMIGSSFLTVLFIGLVGIIWRERWMDAVMVMVFMFVALCLLSTIGQGLAVWVREKNYAPRKEGILVSLAIVFGIVISLAISYGIDEALERYYPSDKKTAVAAKSENKSEQAKSPQKEEVIVAPSSSSSTSVEVEVKDAKPKSQEEKKQSKSEIYKLYENEAWFKVVVKILSFLPLAFIIFYIGSVFDLWFFFRQRRRLKELQKTQEYERAQTARREAELKLSILAAQVEPHFLFNTLAGVRSAILIEPLRATAIVDHLVDYLRSTIPQMRGDGALNQAHLKNQLDAARAYLSLMQARIPRLSFQIESELEDAAMPPLMLISLIENAVKHGIEPKIGPVHIHVHVSQMEEEGEAKLLIAVIDNGVGFGGSTSGSGIGLSNIRERLEAMFGTRARLTLKANPDGGVNASIVFPLQMDVTDK
jgi:signal transduction histidine kinase